MRRGTGIALTAALVGVLSLSAGCKTSSTRRSGGQTLEATSMTPKSNSSGVVPAMATSVEGAAPVGATFPAKPAKPGGECKS